jgi:heme-degrading monooxygenase HmoA
MLVSSRRAAPSRRAEEQAVYGTIARMTLRPGAEERTRSLVAEYDDPRIPGFKGEHVFRNDRDPNEFFLVIAFESKAAYEANASSPEQHQRYLQYRELLAAQPEWHDGEIVHANL